MSYKGYFPFAARLYQVLHPKDTAAVEEELKIVTLENIMADGICNDWNIELKDKLIFVIEEQSTWTVNILVHVSTHLEKSYQDYKIRTDQDIYGRKS